MHPNPPHRRVPRHLHRSPERAPARRGAWQRLAALAALALGLLAAQAQTESGFDLVQLMHSLAQVKSGEATFTETRSVALLERTLESSGRLSFAAPDSFVRETLKPRPDRVAVIGNTVTMSQGGRSRTVALDSVPEAAVIMEAIRGTLTGNREGLERHFKASVSGNAQRWALDLVPRDWRLREQVASVRVSGQRAVVREVMVALADGDRSVMTIEPAVAGSNLIEPAASAPKPDGASTDVRG